MHAQTFVMCLSEYWIVGFQGGITDLWRANLHPVRFHSVEVLVVYSYYMGVTRKRSWEISKKGGGERKFREMKNRGTGAVSHQ